MKLISLTVAALAGSLMAMAPIVASSDESNRKINPWQHCGIGAAIFEDNGTAAALSNVIWDSGTTAVTSATLSPETCNSKEIEVAMFVDQTYDQLAMETAMGEGEHLSAALGLMSCDAGSSQDVVNQLRSDLQQGSASTDFANQTHAEKAYQYYESLNQATADCAG